MKTLKPAGLIILLAASAAAVPFIEAHIPAKGSRAFPENDAACLDSVNHRLFLADDNSDTIFVWDITARRITRGFPAVARAWLMTWMPVLERLVCAGPHPTDTTGLLSMVDPAGERVIGEVVLPERPAAMVGHPSGRVYCAQPTLGAVAVVDVAARSLLRLIPVGVGVKRLFWNSVTDRLYAWTDYWNPPESTLVVIDCRADTVRGKVIVGGRMLDLCYHHPDGRLYGAVFPERALAAIDGESDSVVARIPLPDGPRCVVSDGKRGHLLAGYCDTVCVVDPATGAVLQRTWAFPNPPCSPPDVVGIHLPRDGDFALISGDAECSADLSVYDCRGDSLIVRTDGWAFPRDAFTDAGAGYSFSAGGYSMLTVDVATGRLVDMVSSEWLEPSFVYADTVNRVVYGWGECEMSMAVSMDSNVPIGWPAIGEYITGMWVDSRTGKLYVADRGFDQVLVLDGRARVTNRLSVGPNPELLTGFGDGRVFCAHGGFVVAIDCLLDSVVMTTEWPVSNSVKYMLAASEVDRLIVAAHSMLYVLDPATLAVVGQGDPRGRITAICYDRVHRRVIVACDNGALTALTADSLRQAAATDLEDGLVDIVAAPTSGRIYGCNADRDSLLVFDAGDLARIQGYGIECNAPLTWDPAYDRVYTTDHRDDLLAIDGRTGKFTLVPCGWGYGIAVWPDSGRVYVAAGDGILVVRDTSERLLRLSAGELPLARTAATVLAGPWFESAGRVSVHDVSGRVVGRFLPGRNSLDALAPGVYYLRADEPGEPTRRIVLLR